VVRIKVVNGDHCFGSADLQLPTPERAKSSSSRRKEFRRRFGLFSYSVDQFYIKRLVGLGGETLKLAVTDILSFDASVSTLDALILRSVFL